MEPYWAGKDDPPKHFCSDVLREGSTWFYLISNMSKGGVKGLPLTFNEIKSAIFVKD